MTTTTLGEQIELARQAALAVGKVDAQRREAESLPALEERQAALARRDAARAQLDTTKVAVKARVAELRDAAQKIRTRRDAALAELHALQVEIPLTLTEIRREKNKLTDSVSETEWASRAVGSTLGIDAQYNAWAEVGGLDENLNPNPNGAGVHEVFRKLSDTWFVYRWPLER